MHKLFYLLFILLISTFSIAIDINTPLDIISKDLGIDVNDLRLLNNNSVNINGFIAFGGSIKNDIVIGIAIHELTNTNTLFKSSYKSIADVISSFVIGEEAILKCFDEENLPFSVRDEFISYGITRYLELKIDRIIAQRYFSEENWIASIYMAQKDDLSASCTELPKAYAVKLVSEIDTCTDIYKTDVVEKILLYLDDNSKRFKLGSKGIFSILINKARIYKNKNPEKARETLTRLPNKPQEILKINDLDRKDLVLAGDMMNELGLVDMAINYWLTSLFFTSLDEDTKLKVIIALK